MKKTKLCVLLIIAIFTMTTFSCKKKGCTDETATNYNTEAKKDNGLCKYECSYESMSAVCENITSNTTWTKDNIYVLTKRITVESGVTLTIEPGTIIKCEAGSGSNATSLIIARGAKIMAEGTISEPIIFTSIGDNIEPGQIDSPNLNSDFSGLWGGVIVLGNAPISADAQAVQIEGIPVSDQNGLFGGTNPDDNSGVLKYISIRHGGANIGEGNEINALTLGGVGTGTVVEYIEVIGNQDDGIEWFGGTVNTSHVIIWNCDDDGIDTDMAWSGTLDNFIVISGGSSDHGLEIDGPEGSMLDGHTVRNGSIKGSAGAELGDFRDGARGIFENIYFFGFPDPTVDGRGDLSISTDASASGPSSVNNFAAGDLNFSNLEITLATDVTLADVFKGGTDVYATDVAAGANTVGADKSVFVGWTMTDVRGQLSDF